MSGAGQHRRAPIPWAEFRAREITPELRSRCLDMIGPTEDKRQSCIEDLDELLGLAAGLAIAPKDEDEVPITMYGWSAKEIREQVNGAETLADAAKMLKKGAGLLR
jgi:hypothetical protein